MGQWETQGCFRKCQRSRQESVAVKAGVQGPLWCLWLLICQDVLKPETSHGSVVCPPQHYIFLMGHRHKRHRKVQAKCIYWLVPLKHISHQWMDLIVYQVLPSNDNSLSGRDVTVPPIPWPWFQTIGPLGKKSCFFPATVKQSRGKQELHRHVLISLLRSACFRKCSCKVDKDDKVFVTADVPVKSDLRGSLSVSPCQE